MRYQRRGRQNTPSKKVRCRGPNRARNMGLCHIRFDEYLFNRYIKMMVSSPALCSKGRAYTNSMSVVPWPIASKVMMQTSPEPTCYPLVSVRYVFAVRLFYNGLIPEGIFSPVTRGWALCKLDCERAPCCTVISVSSLPYAFVARVHAVKRPASTSAA